MIQNFFRLINDRKGFATNSSSSHSIVYVPGHNFQDRGADFGNFGFDHFVSSSKEKKNLYLAICYDATLRGIRDPDKGNQVYSEEEIASLITREFGQDILNFMEDDNNHCYVDHESCLIFPKKFHKPDQIDYGFFSLIKERVLHDDVVICGGSSEDEEPHWILRNHSTTFVDVTSSIKEASDTVIVRKEHWTDQLGEKQTGFSFFEKKNGHRQTYALNKNDFCKSSRTKGPLKLQAPLLADLKITDKCPYKCSFCYQSSLPQAPHGDLAYIKSVVDQLSEMKVFEIAYGGGEPTLFPDFEELLRYTKEKGITPNFTTRNLNWIGTDLKETLISHVGAFAYSVHCLKDLEDFIKTILEKSRAAQKVEYLSFYNVRSKLSANIQVVMGTLPFEEFVEVLRLAGSHYIPVTLLGFKDVGFGKKHPVHDYSQWISWFDKARKDRSFNLPRIAIDTALASQSKRELEQLRIPSWCYSVVEGASSVYVDCVDQLIGSCSYLPKDLMKPLHDVDFLPYHWDELEIWESH